MNPTLTPEFFAEHVFEARRFLNKTPGNKAFSVISAGVERTAEGYLVERTTFPYIGIEFVAAGNGRLVMNEREMELSPGIFFCYDRTVPHRINSDADSRMVKYFVDVNGRAARSLLREARLGPGTFGRSTAPDRVVSLFDELVRAGLDGGPHVDALCRSLVEAIAWRLTDRLTEQTTGNQTAFENYLHARREIDRFSGAGLKLDEIAGRCGMTSSYLCRLFKRFDTTTPYQRLTRLRVAHAAGQLAGGKSIKQVAHEFGYANVFHFSRQFRNVFGVPPSQVRPGMTQRENINR